MSAHSERAKRIKRFCRKFFTIGGRTATCGSPSQSPILLPDCQKVSATSQGRQSRGLKSIQWFRQIELMNAIHRLAAPGPILLLLFSLLPTRNGLTEAQPFIAKVEGI